MNAIWFLPDYSWLCFFSMRQPLKNLFPLPHHYLELPGYKESWELSALQKTLLWSHTPPYSRLLPFKTFFLLKYSWFIILCQFLLHSKVTQSYMVWKLPKKKKKERDTPWICLSSLSRGHANLCIIPILVYVLLKWAQVNSFLNAILLSYFLSLLKHFVEV